MLIRIIITLVLVAFAGVAVYLHFEQPDQLAALCREDGVLEYTQAVMFLAASVFFVMGLARLRFRNIWYMGYALLFFMLAGEEISWGQRLFDIETPETLAELNVQGETNLHNIESVHGSIRAVGLLVLFGICFAIPAAYLLVKPLRHLIHRWHHPVFPIWAGIFTIIGFLFMAVPRMTIGVNFQLDEVGELFVAVAILIFGFTVIRGDNPRPPALHT